MGGSLTSRVTMLSLPSADCEESATFSVMSKRSYGGCS